jgi:putative nucleotidyltransferase with HDIG domain
MTVGNGSVSDATSAQKIKVPVGINSFPLDLMVPFDVYAKSPTGKYSCVLRKWSKFDQMTKDALKKQGMVVLYVEGDAAKVKQYLDKEKPEAVPAKAAGGNFAYSNDKSLYHHVSRVLLPPGTQVGFSIFTVDNMRFKPIVSVMDGKTAAITESVKSAPGDIYIKVSDLPLFREFLTAPSKAATPQVKAATIKESVKISVRDFLSDTSSQRNTEGVVDSANQIIGVLKRKEVALSDLLMRARGDWHIYNHSNNVAVLATAMAVAMRVEKVENLAIAAMVHDIGKTVFAPELLNKKERLTDQEFALWKRHVADGVQMLQGKGLSSETLNAVRQHHERLSGNGYPYGLKGMAVSTFGRIMSIVDCYDALVTPKVFKPAMTSYTVLDLITKETRENGDFDADMVKLLIHILKGQGKI